MIPQNSVSKDHFQVGSVRSYTRSVESDIPPSDTWQYKSSLSALLGTPPPLPPPPPLNPSQTALVFSISLNCIDHSSCTTLNWGARGIRKLSSLSCWPFTHFYIMTKSMRALWLVNQLWVIVPVNSQKNRASSEFLYKSNIPQVSMGYRLINHLGCW